MAFFRPLLVLVGVSAASATSPSRGRAPFLARTSQSSAFVAMAAPAPVAAVAAPPAAAAPVLPVAAVPAPAPPVAPPPPATPMVDCAPTCKQAKQMWKDSAEAQEVAIALDKNRTAKRILAEADLLAEDVKLKMHGHGQNIVGLLDQQVHDYMNGRVKALQGAIANRHQQVLIAEQQQFGELQAHQGRLVEAMMKDLIQHGYDTAKANTAREAVAAGVKFNSNPKIAGAFKEVEKAGDSWVKSYHDSESAAKDGFAAWSSGYNALNSTWSNITGTFEETNFAAKAARGLGPDTRWVGQVVRVASDVAQAATTESNKMAAEADVADEMSKNSEKLVSGNSGSIVILNDMLDKAESQTEQAEMSK